MSRVRINFDALKNVVGKVVVITGGATGIGEKTVQRLCGAGARVVIGDTNEAARKLAESFPSNAHFVKTDVTNYGAVLALFRKAFALHSRIDHAISNAGVVEIGSLFDTGVTDDKIEEEPTTLVLDVNLKGTIFFSRIAVHFLRKSLAQNKDAQKDASLTLVSSVAGFGDWPGLFVYSASKHGVMGLFRSTKNFLLPSEGIRVNAVLPNMTRTQMVTGVVAAFEANNIPVNEPGDVADTLSHILVQPINGQALYVSGGKTYEIEERLEEVKPLWLGKQLFEELTAGQAILQMGSGWTKR